jgi:hypothetical protein
LLDDINMDARERSDNPTTFALFFALDAKIDPIEGGAKGDEERVAQRPAAGSQ